MLASSVSLGVTGNSPSLRRSLAHNWRPDWERFLLQAQRSLRLGQWPLRRAPAEVREWPFRIRGTLAEVRLLTKAGAGHGTCEVSVVVASSNL
jgi:hypothetical protein